jgi:hypothetical protein
MTTAKIPPVEPKLTQDQAIRLVLSAVFTAAAIIRDGPHANIAAQGLTAADRLLVLLKKEN